ncbi:MAG: hypothetical protein AB7G34_07040 [Hyphomicrobiales bacterium]
MKRATHKPRVTTADMDRQRRILWLALAFALTGGLLGQLLLLTSP